MPPLPHVARVHFRNSTEIFMKANLILEQEFLASLSALQ